jgi:hypothetical protein
MVSLVSSESELNVKATPRSDFSVSRLLLTDVSLTASDCFICLSVGIHYPIGGPFGYPCRSSIDSSSGSLIINTVRAADTAGLLCQSLLTRYAWTAIV